MDADVVHGLGAALLLALALAGVVWAVAVGRSERRARLRARRVFGLRRPPRQRLRARGAATRWAPVAGAVCAGYALAGGIQGCLLGLIAGYGVRRWQRRSERREGVAALTEPDPQLPLAADLLAACVSAGASPVAAAEAVGESLRGPVAERLGRAAVELRLGGDPERVWGRLAAIPGAGALARCLERAGASGAPAAEQVARIAADCRAEWARAAAARAHRASVMIAAPVGLCLLPAFLAVGVVPVVIGLADGVLNGN
ncbi:type II secretion system F family protein [Streptomyces monticola]|uniref:Type II secretion system F family protein n=1 Tax=Streptomyces monticola TaxID=2666263 RepID=A0ABW2JRC7_9ACTN